MGYNLQLKESNYYPWQWEFLKSPKPINGAVAGMGAGKTHIFLHKTAINLVTRKNKHGVSNGWIVYPTYDLADDLFVEPFKEILGGLGISYEYNMAKHRFITAAGNIKIYQLQKPHRIIGAELTFIGFDEFDVESWKNCDLAFKKAIGRMRGSENCELYIVSTPEGYHYCHKIFAEDLDKNRLVVHGKTTDNIALPKAYVKLMEDAYDSRMLAAYRDGKFVNIQAGNTYYNFNRENNVDDKAEYIPSLPICAAVDFNVVPMAASLVQLHRQRPQIRVFDTIELRHSGGREILTDTMAKEIKARYRSKSYIVYPDPANQRHTSALDTDHEILRHNGFIVKAKPKAPRVADRVNAVNKVLEGNLIIHPRCKPLIIDLEQTSNVPGTRQIDKSNKERSHFSDGLGYLVDLEFPIIKPLLGSMQR